MKDKNLLLFLYPVSSIKMSDPKKVLISQILDKEYAMVSADDIEEILLGKINFEDIQKTIQEVKDSDRLKYFKITKSILDLVDFTKEELIKIQSIAKALNIKTEETGYNFDIYNADELNEFEFINAVRKFSLVSAAIGFIPLPIADIALLTPIQVGLVAKIADIYKYKIEPKEFLKMLTGVIGAGIIFRIAARVFNSFIPFLGWGINAAIAYAGTYALGIITKRYLEANGELNNETIKEIWAKSFEDGKKEFVNLKDYVFKMKDELIRQFENIRDKAKSNCLETDENDDITEDVINEEINKKDKSKKKKSDN